MTATLLIYQTGDLSLDTEQFRLWRGECDVEVEPQVFDLLTYLIKHRERVVTRDELLQQLWKGRVVSDGALSARLKAARKAVGDSGSAQSIIKTIHGRGYQFVADVSEVDDIPSVITNEDQPLDIPSEKPSIAVLPFLNMSGDPAQEYFADGLTEDLITGLSRFHDLFVIARHSSFAYKGKSPIIQEVSHELRVRYILEGSVQKSGDRIRITAQLIDGHNGTHLWAERYDRKLADVFDVQDEVTETIVGTLASGYGGRLRKAWTRRAQAVGSESVQAFDYFTRGLEAVDHFTAEDNLRGRKHFEKAVKLDPSYAKARGKLAWTYILEAVENWGNDYEGAMAKGLEVASQSVDSDDSEPWAHWALGACYVYLGQHDKGISELERAAELNSNDADVLADLGLYLSYAGRAEEGRMHQLRAMRLNPHYPEYYLWQLGMINHDARRYEEAVTTLQRLRSIEPVLSLLYLAASHAALGNASEAQKVVQRVMVLDPEATVDKWTSSGMAPYKIDADRERFRENLLNAGLP